MVPPEMFDSIQCAFCGGCSRVPMNLPDRWMSVDRATGILTQVDSGARTRRAYPATFNCALAVLVSAALRSFLTLDDGDLLSAEAPAVVSRAAAGWVGSPDDADFATVVFGVRCFPEESLPSDVLAADWGRDDYYRTIRATFAVGPPGHRPGRGTRSRGPQPFGRWYGILLRCVREPPDRRAWDSVPRAPEGTALRREHG